MLKKLKVVFEDNWILVVDKPAGLVVNRSETVKEATLQDELSEYFGLAEGDLGLGDRAGIAHRLDRETSGLLVVAKTKQAFESLQAQFKEREVVKKYIALVHGKVGSSEGVISGTLLRIESKIARVGHFGKFGIVDRRSSEGRPSFTKVSEGKEAVTDYVVRGVYSFREEKFKKIIDGMRNTKARFNYLKKNAREYTQVGVYPKTGRTHQIRVHLKSIGHPVVSDLIYGPNKLINFDLLWCPRLFLHASSIEFTHPKTKKKVQFSSELPADLEKALLLLEK
ncbi:MAG: RluA family pseudouridine synthase [Candidatus Curtissbacteria bacterium]|nr:RluA family pseudouridine synthase [Candidatus Curtissbacteria bacterium]